MATTSPCRPAQPTFLQRLSALLTGLDRGVTWWGAHRAWPANESARIEQRRP